MNRREITETFAAVAEMARAFIEEAEAEIAANAEEIGSHREEIEARDFVERKLRSELADYEKTVAALREQLRAEEARRASYQGQAAVAVRVFKLSSGVDLSLPDTVAFKVPRETWNALVTACRDA